MEALFQPIYTSGGPHIAPREVVNMSLGLYSDYLNWNTRPEVEERLRKILCEIYGHQPYNPQSWKAATNCCYWCFQSLPTD